MLGQDRKMGIAVHPASALDCAQSRKQTQRLNPFRVSVRKGQTIEQNNCLMRWEDTKCPQGRNASRARPIACAPIRMSDTLLSPIPKLASAARPPATRHPSTRTLANPLTLRHLTSLPRLTPECLACPWMTDVCVPLHLCSRRAAQLPLRSMKLERAEKTRNEYRSASRPHLQVPKNSPTRTT